MLLCKEEHLIQITLKGRVRARISRLHKTAHDRDTQRDTLTVCLCKSHRNTP